MANLLVERATISQDNHPAYTELRRGFMEDPDLRMRLPRFVRTHRNLSSFWGYIKEAAPTWAERRKIIHEAFTPLLDHLDNSHAAPIDQVASDAFGSVDPDSVRSAWRKALDRRVRDPEGAITSARTLLETVIKHVLEECDEEYDDKAELPKLYRAAAKALNLAPDQHTEEPIRAILGGTMSVVNGLGTLRNRLSDAHGRGGRRPVKPSPRHASLAVNTAGAIALFLIETLVDRERT
ncbi:MAG: abortive infection family protein [Gammaproteobacteria bacterium]|nr:abortive infection family protein [Gammaproteobacteria bacterium]